jgi:hypothetical protein
VARSIRSDSAPSFDPPFLEDELDRAIAALESTATEFEAQIGGPQPERLPKADAFRFLRRLLNYNRAPDLRLKHDVHVDIALGQQNVEERRGQLRVGQSQVRVLTLMEPPAGTFAGAAQAFATLPGPFILCLTWRRLDHETMQARLGRRETFFFGRRVDWRTYVGRPKSSNLPVMEHAYAAALEADHVAAITAMEVDSHFFGDCTLSLVLMADDERGLDQMTAAARTVIADQDGVLHVEAYNALHARLAIQPGNDAYNLRALTLPETASRLQRFT